MVEVYATETCPYCRRARALLDKKRVSYSVIDVATDRARLTEMMSRSGRRTVPQIFISDTHVGGSDDLEAAERDGLLDKLLNEDAGAAAQNQNT